MCNLPIAGEMWTRCFDSQFCREEREDERAIDCEALGDVAGHGVTVSDNRIAMNCSSREELVD